MSAAAVLSPKRTFTAARCAELLHFALDRTDAEREVDPGAIAGTIQELDRAMNRLASVRLALVAQADRAEVAAESGQSGTDAWLATSSRVGGAQAAGQVGLARALDEELSVTRAALEEGSLSPDHAGVIATATKDLPDGLTRRERERIEWSLVQKAQRVDPSRLRRAARRALEAARRVAREVDAHEDRVLRSEEERALERSRLTLHDNGDGTVTGRFTVPVLAGSVLRKVIEQMVAPRRQWGPGAGPGEGAVRGGEHMMTARTGEGRGVDGGGAEAIDWAHRRGLALTQLLEHLDTDHLHGKAAATVVVTIDEARLRENLGAAHLDTGQDISASEARRLACSAGILPLVLDGESIPLDYGRTQRFFQESQRVALAVRYDTCAAQGCDRPYAWSELHHEDPWATGGQTNLDLAVPLCGFHHRRAHDPAYDCTVRTDGVGIKVVGFRRRDRRHAGDHALGSPERGDPERGDPQRDQS